MSQVHELKMVQLIPASLDVVWKFFSDAHNLKEITPPELNLKITNEVFGTEAYAGQVLTYTVKPLLGIGLEWMTEITHVEPKKFFVDEQRKGPYKLWHHQHHFKEVEKGVEMTDLLHYRMPLGVLGSIAHVLVVKKKVHEIFEYRRKRVEELFR